ncbi:MAG: hypothetical protein ACO1RX_13645 [Candidatus Sericytochromatia bacterium]
MSGQPKFRWLACLWLGLAACSGEPLTTAAPDPNLAAAGALSPGTTRTASDDPASVALAASNDFFDVSGCWRPVGEDGAVASGAAFEFRRVGPNAFVFSAEPVRTKLVFAANRRFEEHNLDDSKPFFPVGYIHSTGVLSPDGNTLERKIEGSNLPQILRRCAVVSERPVVIPGEATPTPQAVVTLPPSAATPPPVGPLAPGVGPLAPPVPQITPQPQATPLPTPVPTRTPVPTATPIPLITPLVIPPPTPRPTATAIPVPVDPAEMTPPPL